MDNLTHASEFVPTAMTSQDEIALRQFKVDPADLTKRMIELERENANLQLLVCHLLKKNEELRRILYQRQSVRGCNMPIEVIPDSPPFRYLADNFNI